jgi:hypothetical protein
MACRQASRGTSPLEVPPAGASVKAVAALVSAASASATTWSRSVSRTASLEAK